VIQEKLTPQNDFWDEKAQERRLRERLDEEIRKLDGTLGLAKKTLALQNAPGWQEFLKAVEDCRAHRRVELELCSGSNDEVRILQGRVRELGALLSMMKNLTSTSEHLEGRLRELQGERQARVRPDGRVIPQGAVT
jgi:hypothetical protein